MQSLIIINLYLFYAFLRVLTTLTLTLTLVTKALLGALVTKALLRATIRLIVAVYFLIVFL